MRLLPSSCVLASVVVALHASALDMTPHGACVLRSAASSTVRRGLLHYYPHGSWQPSASCLRSRLLVLDRRSCSSWALESASASSHDEAREELLLVLEGKIARLAGHEVNINSPKQVSLAVFGRVQSASRSALEEAAASASNLTSSSSSSASLEVSGVSGELSPAQREIAALVLRHRDLTRAIIGAGGAAAADDDDDDILKEEVFVANGPANSSPCASLSVARDDDPNASDEERASGGDEELDLGLDVSARVGLSSWSDPLASSRHHDRSVRGLFERKGSQIHRYWEGPLLDLNRLSAKALVPQLDAAECPMGYDPLARPTIRGSESESVLVRASSTPPSTTAGKKGTFLAYCRDQKRKYPDAIILTRCGDFYETYGVDAIMLVEHCGLNPMAGKAKAGCPIRNVQATLDGLTSKGFRVAVYEEGADTDASPGPGASASSKSRIKNRFLAQIVSPASPTYLYDLVLLSNADALLAASPARPYVGIISHSSGYTVVEVDVEERTVRVSERLTAEAVACRLAASPPVDPLLYVPSMREYESNRGSYSLPFLPNANQNDNGRRLRLQTIPPTLVEQPRPGLNDDERAKNTILSALLKLTEIHDDDTQEQRRISLDSFSLVASPNGMGDDSVCCTHPLTLETAKQLGLMDDRAIPSLVSYLVPDSSPSGTRRFLKRYLLTPPPPVVAQSLGRLVNELASHACAVPPLSTPPVGKVLSLLRAGQASSQVYQELLIALKAAVASIDIFRPDSDIVRCLMTILEYETGMAAEPSAMKQRCLDAIDAIESVVTPASAPPGSVERMSSFGGVVPSSFFERNEASWRGRVRGDILQAYAEVQQKASELAVAVASDFWGAASLSAALQDLSDSKTHIAQDIFNNAFALRDIPSWCSDSKRHEFVHPRDRFGKLIRNRYTTDTVQNAMSDYLTACENAKVEVSNALMELSRTLHDGGHVPAIVQASHANLILSTVLCHVAKARTAGWKQAAVVEDSSDADSAGFFENVFPYWMDRSTAVSNTFDLEGMWFLTAPNMAGKSTVLRSTAAAALLSVCGLAAPLGSKSQVRRFDHLFVRGASADVPAEQKSAFGAEMGDIAALLRCCGQKSLVFVDELGRGTSPKDGTRLAGAVLEEMAEAGMTGMFATHLHDILNLPLQARDRIRTKQMSIHEHDNAGKAVSQYSWTYRIEDGVCTDSMALITASRFGLPSKVLDRAAFFERSLGGSDVEVRQPSERKEAKLETWRSRDRAVDRDDCKTVEARSLGKAQRILEGITGRTAVSIPSACLAPPSLEGQSVVYVLELTDPLCYYVGETDKLSQRLYQHRSKDQRWSRCDAIVVPIAGGKSEARSVESRAIQSLAQAGFNLQSTFDGRSIRPSTLSP